jgi:hypothetical protein
VRLTTAASVRNWVRMSARRAPSAVLAAQHVLDVGGDRGDLVGGAGPDGDGLVGVDRAGELVDGGGEGDEDDVVLVVVADGAFAGIDVMGGPDRRHTEVMGGPDGTQTDVMAEEGVFDKSER